jgi:hypothetical protein
MKKTILRAQNHQQIGGSPSFTETAPNSATDQTIENAIKQYLLFNGPGFEQTIKLMDSSAKVPHEENKDPAPVS